MSEAETGEMVKKKPKVKRCPTCGAKKNDISYTELYELAISRAREVSDLQKQVAELKEVLEDMITWAGETIRDGGHWLSLQESMTNAQKVLAQFSDDPEKK